MLNKKLPLQNINTNYTLVKDLIVKMLNRKLFKMFYNILLVTLSRAHF